MATKVSLQLAIVRGDSSSATISEAVYMATKVSLQLPVVRGDSSSATISEALRPLDLPC
jgi:hypothetical protein